MIVRFLQILALVSLATSAEAFDTVKCVGGFCVGDLVTSYQIERAEVGPIIEFTKATIDGGAKLYEHATVQLQNKTKTVYLGGLSRYTPGFCKKEIALGGAQYEYCIGDEVWVNGKLATYVAHDSDLYLAKSGKVLEFISKDSVVTKNFLNCKEFLAAEICETSQYENAKGEVEQILGVSGIGQFLILTPAKKYPATVSLSELKRRIVKETEFTKRFEYTYTGSPGSNHKVLAARDAREWAIYTCGHNYLGYGRINESMSKIEVKRCRPKLNAPSFPHGPTHPYFTIECKVNIKFRCEDGYAKGLPETDLSDIPELGLFPNDVKEK